jgi:hypothetical protein
MKTVATTTLGLMLLVLFLHVPRNVLSQEPVTNQPEQKVVHIVIKNDGTQFVGNIISRDSRELIINTQNLGEIVIPMHEIREIREAKASEVSATGEYVPAEVFSTRYFITTNGLPIEKGESYIQWNIFGPDFQFGVGENFGLGIMTTWIGMPLIGTAKYSIDLPGNASAGVGFLLGTGSWAAPDFGLMLPFGVFTLGDRVSNINFSLGYGGVFYKESTYDPILNRNRENRVSEGRFLFSIAGMAKAGNKISLVFDSFIVPRGGFYDYTEYVEVYNPNTGWYDYQPVVRRKRRGGLTLLIPGIRLQTNPNKAFQFGFGGAYVDGKIVPTPIPMVQWYQKL